MRLSTRHKKQKGATTLYAFRTGKKTRLGRKGESGGPWRRLYTGRELSSMRGLGKVRCQRWGSIAGKGTTEFPLKFRLGLRIYDSYKEGWTGRRRKEMAWRKKIERETTGRRRRGVIDRLPIRRRQTTGIRLRPFYKTRKSESSP